VELHGFYQERSIAYVLVRSVLIMLRVLVGCVLLTSRVSCMIHLIHPESRHVGKPEDVQQILISSPDTGRYRTYVEGLLVVGPEHVACKLILGSATAFAGLILSGPKDEFTGLVPGPTGATLWTEIQRVNNTSKNGDTTVAKVHPESLGVASMRMQVHLGQEHHCEV
jgi:hypothetical protein